MSSETHYRVCNLCEAMCGIKVNVNSAKMPGDVNIVIKPDIDDPFSKGSMCPKAPALASLHTDPSRLRQPVKRVDDEWVEISWNEAYTAIEENIKRIRREHGEDSIASYLGNPIVHNMGMMLFIKTLTEAIGSKNVFSATSMDQLPHHFAAHFMFGHEFRIPVPDVDRTDFMIIMGANPIASNGSIMTSAGIRERLGAIKQRGGQFVVIDPRRTETAKLATTHHFIKPGTDVFFLLAFLHVLYRDDFIRTDKLNEHLLDLEKLKSVAQCITPSQAESITGVDASEIERLVHDYSKQTRAVLYGRMGLSTQRHGGLCHWLINCINIVSGHFDTPGGMMFPKPAIELARGGSQPKRFARWRSRVRKMPEFYGELPVSAMTEEITTPGAGQVKAFMSVCGNPVLSTPGGNRLDAALPNVEFMFSIDNYINETTRHANIILPTPSGLEVEHFDLIFNLISVTNNVKYSNSVFPPSADTPLDWEVLKELIARLSPSGPGLLHRFKTPRRIVNWGLMLGAYGKLSHPKRWFTGLTLKKVMDSTHGISLGPLQPRVPEGMLTPDKKIHLAPKVITDRLDELMSEYKRHEVNERSSDIPSRPFSLIGRRHVSTNNSWMHQFKKLSASRQVRCTAMINSEDAARLSVVDEEIVKISSEVGEITLPAEVTDTVMPGVISIPHGFGHTRSGTRIPNAEAKPGVSVNDITDHNHVDELTGNAAFSGLNISVEKTETKQTTDTTRGIPLTILYGSRTGNAEFTARDIAKRAKQQGLLPLVKAMDDVELGQLSDWERILIVCSTYGEGEMPDNAHQLWQQINTPPAPDLGNVFFSVLAFGDRSYDTFCEAGKQWDKRLVELGATRIADRTDCDVDYIDATETWVENVLPAMLTVGDLTVVEADEQYLQSSSSVRYGPNNPLSAKLLEKYKLNGDGSSKETYHYVLSLSGENFSYTAGDTLNVLPLNQPNLVKELLALVNIDGQEIIGDSNRSVYERLLNDYEIRIPSHTLLNAIAERSAEQIVREQMSSLLAGDRSTREQYLRGKDVIDLLSMSPGLITSSEALFKVLPPLAPRSYSISSSVNRHPDEIHLTVANVRYSSEERDYCGAASCFLADHREVGDRVDVYFVPNNAFSLPENDTVPIIMIGPGTGVAPFRGFLQEREFRKASGKSWLFFGDRNVENDFLYQQEINTWVENGVLNRLDLAFSRDQNEKVYVQDRMLENAAELYRWLEDGAVVYVCGDANNMAKDVDTALHRIVQEQGQYSEGEASAYVTTLSSNKRYLLDVY